MWVVFLKDFNGKAMFPDQFWCEDADLQLYTDASGIGCGGYFQGKWFQGRWPQEVLNHNRSIAWQEFFPNCGSSSANDVLQHNKFSLRGIIAETLWGIRHTLPNTTIIWSDGVPRHYFHGELNPGAGRRIINFINSQAHRVIFNMDNAHFVRNREVFPPRHFALYRCKVLKHVTNIYILRNNSVPYLL